MSAVALFDVLAKAGSPAAPMGSPDVVRLSDFARQLIASSLADLERVHAYDDQAAPFSADQPQRQLELLTAVWQLFSEWADEADLVLSRAKPYLSHADRDRELVLQLTDAIGRARARLNVSPEQTARALRDIKAGRTIPMETLRDEVRARLRA